MIICLSMCACAGSQDTTIDTEQEGISALKNDERAIKDGFLAYNLGFYSSFDPVLYSHIDSLWYNNI